MNSVVLIGNLARDPELSYTANTQTAVCHFTLAVSRPRRNGEDQGADFLRVTVFGRQAENCDRFLAKGRQCAVHGRIETGSYKNREGVTVNTVDIIADNVEFLRDGSGSGQGGSYQGGQSSYGGGRGSFGGGRDAGFGGEAQDTGFSAPAEPIGGFDDMPDTFQAAEDDIPF